MPISCDTDTMSIDQEVITIDAEVDGWYESFENIANQENEFMKAVSNGDLRLMNRMVVEQDFSSLNCQDLNGLTPLHHAAIWGIFEVVEYLLRKGASVDSKDKKNTTPLHLAAAHGRLETIILLLGRGAEKDAQTQLKLTPLHFAVMNDFFGAVKILLDWGARIDIKDSNDKTALDLAYTNDIARILMVQDWHDMRSMRQTLVPAINGKPVLFSNVVNADIDPNIWHMITIFEDDNSSERYRLDVIMQQDAKVQSLKDRLHNTRENLGSKDIRFRLTSQWTSNLGVLNYLQCYNTWKLSNPRQSNPTPSNYYSESSNSGTSNSRRSSTSGFSNSGPINPPSSNPEASNLELTYPGPPKSKRQLRDEAESNATSTGIIPGPPNSKHQRRDDDDDGESNAASTNQELRQEIANLKQRLQRSNQSRMVAICQYCLRVPDGGSSTFSLNCGHLPFCDRCSKSIIEDRSIAKRICPICKANANYRFRVFVNVMKYHSSGHENYVANVVNLEN